jgi:hypothetical protein
MTVYRNLSAASSSNATRSRDTTHTSVRRVDQRQLINLIARLPHETHNAKTRISSISKTAASSRTRLQSPACASRSLNVEVPCQAVLLASAKLRLRPLLAGVESQRDCRTTCATVCESRTTGELDADGVETLSTPESYAGGFWRSGHGWQAAEPGSVRTAGEVTLAQTGRKRPVESGEDGVVIGQDGAFVGSVAVEKVLAVVCESGCFEVEDLGAAVEALVDDFAGVVLGWIVAEQCVCASYWVDATALQLNPWVGETTLCAKCGAESCVGCTGVSGICISHDKDGVSGRPSADVISDLLQVGIASYVVLVFVTGLLLVYFRPAMLSQSYPASACKLYTSM